MMDEPNLHAIIPAGDDTSIAIFARSEIMCNFCAHEEQNMYGGT